MFTSDSPVWAMSRDNSPGWSAIGTNTVASSAGRSPCLPGMRRVPARAGLEDVGESRAGLTDRPDQAVEVGTDLLEQLAHLTGVAAQDVGPQRGVAAGDPGDVTQAGAGQREV